MNITEHNKDYFKKKYEEAKLNVVRSMERRDEENKKRLSAFEKYYEDITKVSKDFELVKNERKETFTVFVNNFPVDKFDLTFYDCEIKYVGPIPERNSRNSICIEISEHHVSRRGSWRSTNEGYKIKTRINYEDSPYYKSGRTAAKKVLEHVEELFNQEKRRKQQEDINQRAYKELSDKFPYKFIRTISKTSQPSTFIVENANQSHITLSYNYNSVEDVITFKVIKVEVPSNIKLENLVESLGRI